MVRELHVCLMEMSMMVNTTVERGMERWEQVDHFNMIVMVDS